jgi:hypothetical protein
LGDDLPAVAEVIQELGGFGRINPALSQCRDDLVVGTALGHQPYSHLNIRLQKVVCHSRWEVVYPQSTSSTSQHFGPARGGGVCCRVREIGTDARKADKGCDKGCGKRLYA